MILMIHYTMNSGDWREMARSEVNDNAFQDAQKWCHVGEYDFSVSGWKLKITSPGTGLAATVISDNEPISSLWVAQNEQAADKVWPFARQLYLAITEMPLQRSLDFCAPQRPESVPWCAVIRHDPAKAETVESTLTEFEHSLAWAWIESCAC